MLVELNGTSQHFLFVLRNSATRPIDSSTHLRSADSDASPLHSLYNHRSDHRMNEISTETHFTCVSYAEARMPRNTYRLDVCPSLRLSVTRWYCIKTAENIVMLSSPHDSPLILVLCVSRSSRNSDGVTPCGAAKQRWGVKISQFSTNNLLYLKNG